MGGGVFNNGNVFYGGSGGGSGGEDGPRFCLRIPWCSTSTLASSIDLLKEIVADQGIQQSSAACTDAIHDIGF